MSNEHLEKDKVVLEVGCGSGILSMFVAQAGAKRVFGIEPSRFSEFTKKIVQDNNLSDVITIIKGKIEDVTLPDGVEQVDVIISDWMGYCLFYGSKLNSVLSARDKWLKPGGVIFPDKARLYLNGIENCFYKDSIEWWDDVYGFDMSCIKSVVMSEPLFQFVHKDQVVTSRALLKEIDMYTFTEKEIYVSCAFTLKALRDDYVTSLVAYFKVEFTKGRVSQNARLLSTPPYSMTFWKQTVLPLKLDITCKEGEVLEGTFAMCPMPGLWGTTDFDVNISITFHGDIASLQEINNYRLAKFKFT